MIRNKALKSKQIRRYANLFNKLLQRQSAINNKFRTCDKRGALIT